MINPPPFVRESVEEKEEKEQVKLKQWDKLNLCYIIK